MADQSYLDYLRSDPNYAGKSNLELIKLLHPEVATASDGKTPMSDMAITKSLADRYGVKPEDFDAYAQKLGLEKSGPIDEIGAGFADGMAGMQNTATNAFPAWTGRLAQQQLSPKLNEFLGTKELVEENLAEYQKQEQLNSETSESQAPTKIEDAKTYGDYLRYFGYATGNAAASVAEVAGEAVVGAAVGAGIGALSAGPAGAVAGAAVGGVEGTAIKQGIKALIKDQVKNAVSKEVLTSAAVKKGAKYGAYTGANTEMFKIQTGDYDQELLDRNIDNPALAGGLGVAGTALEFAPEIAAFGRINKAFNTPEGKEAVAHALISKVAGKDFLKTLGKEALINAPAEGATEAAQQGLTELADKFVNDANLMTPEVASRVMNSFAQGFLGSAGITAGGAAAQTIGKYPLSTPNPTTATGAVQKQLGPVSNEKVNQARSLGVVEDDGEVDTQAAVVNPPAPTPTPEQVALTPTVTTPEQAQLVDAANQQVNANLEKAQTVADTVAAIETKQVTKARRQPKPAPAAVTDFKFPKELGSPKPTVNGVAPKWNNDLEKALYIVGNPKTKSKRHDDYVKQIKAWKPEWSDADVQAKAKQTIQAAKESVKSGEPLNSSFVQDAPKEAQLMTKADGKFVQLGDGFGTTAVSRSPLITPTKQPEIAVRDEHGGQASFTVDPKTNAATAVSFSQVDPGVAASNPDLAKTLTARPFLTNTVDALKQMGATSVDLNNAVEVNPEEVKSLVDQGIIKEGNKPGVFDITNNGASFPKGSFDATVKVLMDRFKKDGNEHVVLFDGAKGTYSEMEVDSRRPKSISFTADQITALHNKTKSTIMVHNHPGPSSLSFGDVIFAAQILNKKPSSIISAVFDSTHSVAEVGTPFMRALIPDLGVELIDRLNKKLKNVIRAPFLIGNPELLVEFNSRLRHVWQEPILKELDNRGVLHYNSNINDWVDFTKKYPEVAQKLTTEIEKEVESFITKALTHININSNDYFKRITRNDLKITQKAPGRLYQNLSEQMDSGDAPDAGRFGRGYGDRSSEAVLSSVLGANTRRQEAVTDKGLTNPKLKNDSLLPITGNEVTDIAKTPLQHEAKYQDLMRSIRDVVKQVVGDNVSVEFWNTMTAKTEDGRMRDLRGYQHRNTIAVAIGINEKLGMDPLESGVHEAFHAVYNMLPQSDKAILEADRANLQKYVRRQMRSLYNSDIPTVDLNYFDAEEIGALAFGLYAKRKVDGVETNQSGAFKILNKIFGLLKQMGRVISGKGYRSADHVFRDVFRGDYADNGKMSPDTAIKLQQSLAEQATIKAQAYNEKKFYSNTDAADIAKDRGLSKYESEVSDSISRGVPPKVAQEYGNMAYFFDSLKSIPGIARNNPLVANIKQILRGVHEETRAVLADFSIGTNDILSRGPNAIVAAEQMDYLSNNKITPTFTADENGVTIQYKNKDGKRVTLKGDVADAYMALHHQFKKVLGMQEALLTHDLPDDVKTLQDYQNYIAERGPDITAVEEQRLRVWNKLRAMIESDQPYFPQMRFGEHAIKVERIGENGKPEMVGFWMLENDLFSATGQPNKTQEAVIRKEIEAKYKDDKSVTISNTFKLTNNDVSKLFDHSKMRTEEVISGFLGDELADKLAEDLGVPRESLTGSVSSTRDALLDNKAFLEKFERKIDKMFGEREGYDGYSKEYARVIDTYFKNYPRQIIQAKHRKITNKYRVALAHSQANTKVKETINNLIAYSSSPRADWGLARQVNFATTLGLNPASAVLQLSTLATTLPATIMQWQGSPIAALGTIGKATADAKRVLDIVNEHKLAGLLIGKTAGGERLANIKIASNLLKGVLSPDEIALVVQMYSEGDIVPVMAQNDVLGETPSESFANKQVYHAKMLGDSVMKVLAGPMATVEQFSRLTSVLATHRSMKGVDHSVINNVLKDDGNFTEAVHYNMVKGMSEEEAVKHAAIQNTVDNTHAVFGKYARNWNQRGFFGALPFAFMNFPMQAMEYLFHLSKRSFTKPEARFAMAYLVASMFMMGGLAGMPAWELFKSLYEKIYYLSKHEKVDLNYEIQNVLKNSANLPSPMVHAIMQGGLSEALGADVGGRMSIPFFWQGLMGSALKGQVGVTDAMGVQGGLINNLSKQTGKWMDGEASLPEAALMGLSPVFVRNAFESLVSWPSDGVKSGKGNVLLTPEDVSTADQIKKALGFTPENVANARQAEYVQYLKINGTSDYKSAKTSELANLKLDIFKAGQSGNTKKVESLRTEYAAKYQELLEFLRKTNEGGLSARSIDGIKSSIDQKYQAKKNPQKERTAKEQKVADQIRDTYGLNK